MVTFLAAGVCVLLCSASIVAAAGDITDDSYFFGQSPPFYPTPQVAGTGKWTGAVSKAQALVAEMTPDEKVVFTCGAPLTNGCAGIISSLPRLNFSGMCLQDGSHGVHDTNYVNAYPAEISVGASWNTGLAYLRGSFMGKEFLVKGVNVLLGPVVGPLGRVATGGRNWEGFSNDPMLVGSLAASTVKGVQDQGVIASTKHYIANEQETNRNPSTNTITITDPSQPYNVSSVSSNVDDRTLHELYLWPFAGAVRVGSGAVMASYNRVNNSFATQNSKLLNDILKSELGFQGWVVSDWLAQHAGYQAALAGLDMMMPSCYDLWGSNLTLAVSNGTVPQSRLDDMVTRVLAPYFLLGQDANFPDPGIGLPIDASLPHMPVNARNPASKSTLFMGAVEGHVLVKNIRNTLPFSKPRLLSVYGYDAVVSQQSSPGIYYSNGFEAAMDTIYSAGAATGIDFGPQPPLSQIADGGTLICGGGSGANSPPYISGPLDALQQQAYLDDTNIFWDVASVAPTPDPTSDACLVFINAFATEGTDRTGLHDYLSDGLVHSVASTCNNTIVVLHNAGVRLVDQWAENDNVTAIIFAHLPGQESGRAIVSLLYGQENFSGKLPYTVPKNESDYGTTGLYAPTASQTASPFAHYPQSNFTEGLYIDYRYFDKYNITPRYEFGFGMSYTTFEYSSIDITAIAGTNTQSYPRSAIVSGGRADLWDVLASADLTVSNTGAYNGQEVVQLYVGIPTVNGLVSPVRQLRGFEKVSVDANGTAKVHFDLTRRDLSVWDVVAQEWLLPSGSFEIYVGASSRDLRSNGTLTL